MKIEQNNRKNLKQKQKIIEKYYQDLLFSWSWRLTVGENFRKKIIQISIRQKKISINRQIYKKSINRHFF